jgi:hypothetical protein
VADHARTTRARAAEVGDRFAALAATPAPGGQADDDQDETPAARRSTGAMPAAQKPPKRWPVRVPLNVDEEMRRDLELARLDDRIDTTARIRAMIRLWQEDDRLRARVNKRATAPDCKSET